MQVLATIIVTASIYALISCGYVLIYRVSRVLNLAQGELMMVGAYLLFTTASLFNGSPYIALGAALILSLLVGVAVYLFLMRHMTGEAVIAAVLITIALGILLRGLMILLWTAQERHPIDDLGWSNPSLSIAKDVTISGVNLLTIIVTAVSFLGLFLFFRFTKWGIRMRAAGENPLLAAQRGVQLHLIYAVSWGLATLSGSMGGMLIAAESGIDQSMIIIGLKAFPAAIIGGLDSLGGALIGSFILAAAEILAIHFIDPLVSDVVPFMILLGILIIRPWGLFGTKEELERV